MNREKQIQIPESLFCQLGKYFLLDIKDNEIEEYIKKGLSDKLEAITRHNLYTQYKTAPTPEQQEKARQEYLDNIGVPDSFRW